MSESFIKIVENTGRKLVECSCAKCQSQCKVPCLGTPDDIQKLIRAGYVDKLRMTLWCVGVALGKSEQLIPMVQIEQTDSGCVFFKNGLCELHDLGLKPTEGKLSHHELKLDNFVFELSLHWNVAKEWLEPENLIQVVKVFAMMELYLKGLVSK